MKPEQKEQIIQIVKMIVVVICASLYAIGGTEEMGGKWLRRYLSPVICGGAAFAITFDWLVLVKMPILILASTLGYGADQTWLKIIKRAYCGLAFGLGATIYELINKRWILSVYFILLITTMFIFFGVFNPFGSARIEETMIGCIIYYSAIMPLKRRVK